MVVPATLFEKFGFNYTGPIDGHDLESLIPTLENIRHLSGPQFLHVVTARARATSWRRPIRWPTTGRASSTRRSASRKPSTPAKPTFTQVFGQWLCDMAAQDRGWSASRRPCARAPAWSSSRSASRRYFDVGIAEQHAVTFAAGLACEGLKPVVAIYSTFLQRAYDQLIHDVAMQKLPVVLALDRAGLVGADGATHAGAYDIPSCAVCRMSPSPARPTSPSAASC
jgi:1-deoxy-D-xylulose-5-phosphate synthase